MIAVLGLLVLALGSQEPDAVGHGADAYREARWAEAYASFSDALGQVVETEADGAATPGALEFALGACAEQLGELPRALWHYRRAQSRLRDDAAVAQRLTVVEARAGLPADGSAAPRPRSAAGWWAMLLLGIASEGCGLWLGLRRSRLAGLLLTLVGTAAAVTVLLGPGPVLLGLPQPSAVVMIDGQGLRAQPHASLPTGSPLVAGSGVEVLARSDRWARIRAQDALGWVPSSALGFVDESGLPLR